MRTRWFIAALAALLAVAVYHMTQESQPRVCKLCDENCCPKQRDCSCRSKGSDACTCVRPDK